jgi:four helix bundle protein
MSVRYYRELIAWQRAMDLAVAVYEATKAFPHHEQFGLTGQVRRAAVSIPSNVAEGQGRGSTKEFVNFLRIAAGSLQETETQLLLAHRLGYLDARQLQPLLELADEVSRIINGLMRSLLSKQSGH